MAEVRLENVVKKFDEVVAVENFNLTIDDKEFVVLVAPICKGWLGICGSGRGSGCFLPVQHELMSFLNHCSVPGSTDLESSPTIGIVLLNVSC